MQENCDFFLLGLSFWGLSCLRCRFAPAVYLRCGCLGEFRLLIRHCMPAVVHLALIFERAAFSLAYVIFFALFFVIYRFWQFKAVLLPPILI
jgi:hypothetical protein